MIANVQNVFSEKSIRIDRSWEFHGIKGNKVTIVGLKSADPDNKNVAIEELRNLLLGNQITISEKWYVRGSFLVAVVLFNDKNIYELLPHRQAYIIEPSRKHHPDDSIPLVSISGGLPKLWENPLLGLDNYQLPFFKEIIYETKYWLANYEKSKKIIDHLYVDHTNLNSRNLSKIDNFFKAPGQATLIIFGDCGTGKSWFVIRNFIENRPPNTDFAYIDLRGRPSKELLIRSINRELGLFLDKQINEKLDICDALKHYLYPIVKPLFTQDTFDPNSLKVKEKLYAAFERISINPDLLDDYNDIRLGYYDNFGKTIFIIVDNIDNYPEDEQLIVFDEVIRTLSNHPGVKLIVPLRPTSELLIERMRQGLDFMPVSIPIKSPNIKSLIERRLSININGDKLDLNSNIINSKYTWQQLLDMYINSPGASLLRDLSCVDSDIPPHNYSARDYVVKDGYDCRHYLRLFRRLLFSDVLLKIENICNEYYALHALLLRPGESFSPETSFLYNLFDNLNPELTDNTLIRYRVLEYFHNHSDYQELFNIYFSALGTGPRIVRKIVETFVKAGLLTPKIKVSDDKEVWECIYITNAGRRHFGIVRNLWYGICVKTGMFVEPDMIKRGENARDLASRFVDSPKVLEFYAQRGWVSDEDFLDFLDRQEELENQRISDYQISNPESIRVLSGMLEYKGSPRHILSYEYAYQIRNWQKKKGEKL
jgi:hypothetical protein